MVLTAGILTAPREAWAINNGSPTPSPHSVVLLAFWGTDGGHICSGTLVTPVHVVTAAHCFNGTAPWPLFAGSDEGILPGAPVAVRNEQLPSTLPDLLPGDLSFYVPGQAPAPQTYTNVSPIDFSKPSASEFDLAILSLAKRVPLAQVPPAQLPFDTSGSVSACPSSFTGAYYGFGPGSGAWGFWADGQGGQRRVGNHGIAVHGGLWGDIYYARFDLASQFFHGIPILGDWLNALTGAGDNQTLQAGDSGGPLFRSEIVTKLCGVNSALIPVAPDCELSLFPPGYFCTLAVENHYARLDRDGPAAWARGILVDSRGNWKGTCGASAPPQFSDVDSDGDFMPDACDPCPYLPDLEYRFTGTPTPLPDFDKDGIPDVCDSCPDAPNPRQVVGTQWTQPDADGDKLGDQCDSCPHSDVRKVSDFACCNSHADCGNPYGSLYHSRCFPIASETVGNSTLPNACPGFAGRCSRGVDKDLDGVAEACDNCRTQWNPNQADDDHDGAGNVCDNCPGTREDPEPYPNADHGADKNDVPAMECSTDANCVAKHAQGQCGPAKLLPQPGGGVVLGKRYCTKFADDDGDELGNACDNCPNVSNAKSDYGGVNNQANCNIDIELARGEPYPYVGDACDPNPCTRTQTGIIHNTGEDVWINVSLHPQVLPKSVLAQDVQSQAFFDHKYTGTPDATVGARFCDCVIQGKAVGTVEECKDACPLDAGEYVSSAFWFVPNMVPAPLSQASLPALPPPGYFTPGAEFSGLPTEEPHPTLAKGGDQLAAYGAAPTPVSWDLGQAPAPGFGLSKGKLGVLWTAVRDVPQMTAGAPQIFQSHSNHYDSGFYGEQLKFEINGTALFACFFCQVDPCPQCAMSLDIHNLLIDPTQPVVAAKSTTQSIDLTASFSSAALDALLEPNVRWLQAAERGTWMKRGAVGLVSLAPDATRVSSALVQVGGLVQPATRSAGDALISAALELEPPSTGPAARSDFAAVLSGLENAVFVLGGKLLSDGSQPADVWRYGIESREWMRLPISGPTPRLVLAATYQPETRSLWLIDADAGPGVARVLRLSLDNLQVEVVGLYPRAGQVTRVELSNAPFGEFLLSGTSTKLGRVASVVLRPGKHHLFTVGGRFTPGQLALEPTLTRRGLTLPLAGAGGTVQNAFVAADDVYYAPAGAGPGQTPSKPTKPVLEAPTKLKPTVADCL